MSNQIFLAGLEAFQVIIPYVWGLRPILGWPKTFCCSRQLVLPIILTFSAESRTDSLTTTELPQQLKATGKLESYKMDSVSCTKWTRCPQDTELAGDSEAIAEHG